MDRGVGPVPDDFREISDLEGLGWVRRVPCIARGAHADRSTQVEVGRAPPGAGGGPSAGRDRQHPGAHSLRDARLADTLYI